MLYLRYSCPSIVLLSMLQSACVGDGGEQTTSSMDMNGQPEVSIILDLGIPDVAISPDANTTPDAVLDALPVDVAHRDMAVSIPDAGTPIVVNNCDEACARFAQCERLDVFGDETACQAACARSSRDGLPEEWFRCLRTESCNLLHRCRPPEPRALDCTQVCTSVSECTEDVVIANCPAECEIGNANDGFSRCGEEIYGGMCDMDEFWTCLGREVYTGCVDLCTTGLECNLVREQNCLKDCLSEVTSIDPLQRHRATQRNQCVRLAGEDCLRADTCINPMIDPQPGGPPNQQSFCQRWDMCFANMLPCGQIWPIYSQNPAAATCAFQLLAGPCPADPIQIIQQCLPVMENPPQQNNGCPDYCEAQEFCDLLPGGVDRVSCLQLCAADLQQENEADALLAVQRITCGQQNTCADFEECLGAVGP